MKEVVPVQGTTDKGEKGSGRELDKARQPGELVVPTGSRRDFARVPVRYVCRRMVYNTWSVTELEIVGHFVRERRRAWTVRSIRVD